MPAFTAKKMLVVPLAMLAVAVLFTVAMHRSPVDFSAEVKPILNKKCISCHGGVKKQGKYREYQGPAATSGKVTPNDIQATLLHQLGFDHEKFTYQFQGRPFRLTDVSGKVIEEIIA